jgi:hypothetical protein
MQNMSKFVSCFGFVDAQLFMYNDLSHEHSAFFSNPSDFLFTKGTDHGEWPEDVRWTVSLKFAMHVPVKAGMIYRMW